MGVNVEFDTNGAAFDAECFAMEVARILRRVADRVERGEDGGTCVDINGNSVGAWEATLDGEESEEEE